MRGFARLVHQLIMPFHSSLWKSKTWRMDDTKILTGALLIRGTQMKMCHTQRQFSPLFLISLQWLAALLLYSHRSPISSISCSDHHIWLTRRLLFNSLRTVLTIRNQKQQCVIHFCWTFFLSITHWFLKHPLLYASSGLAYLIFIRHSIQSHTYTIRCQWRRR